MKSVFVAMLFVAASLAAPFSLAQDKDDAADLNVMRQSARADKRAFVASALDLTPAEAKRFWPIYDAYQRELNLANQQRTLTIESAFRRNAYRTPMRNGSPTIFSKVRKPRCVHDAKCTAR